MKSANLNQAQVLQAIQVYTPQFTAVDLQRSLAYIDSQSSEQVQGVISSLQQVGLLPYIKVLYSSAQLLAQYISANNPSGNRVVAPLFTLPTPPPSEPGGGQGSGGGPAPVQGGGDGGGDGPQPPVWTCAADGAGVLVAGTAFAVITVMTLPISGPILLGEAWIAAATWGGLAAAGWGVGHFIGCGF